MHAAIKKSWIERTAEALRLLPRIDSAPEEPLPDMPGMTQRTLTNFPPPEQWADWKEYDAKAWPRRRIKNYSLIPTTCFNCEAACGLVAYVDKATGDVQRFEGNPYHPASRGRNCAKGPATINQIHDPERILHPMKRVGARGAGQWEQVT